MGELVLQVGLIAGMCAFGARPRVRALWFSIAIVMASLSCGAFLPLFTHAAYEPPAGCGATTTGWPAPHRGTVAYTFGLCCGREWMLGALGSAYFAGSFVGSYFGGLLSDSRGRLVTALGSAVLNAVALAASAFAPNAVTYGVLRFITGASATSSMLAAFTLLMEWAPASRRSSLSASAFAATALGELLLVGIVAAVEACGYVSSWRAVTVAAAAFGTVLPLALGAPMLIESPQWLATRDQGARAVAALRKAGLRASTRLESQERSSGRHGSSGSLAGSERSGGALEVFRILLTPASVTMMLLWFSASGSYYGLSLSADALSKGMPLYAGAALSAVSELPSAVLAAYLLDVPRLGRRLSTYAMYLASSASCLAAGVVGGPLIVPASIAGKLFATAAFDGIYTYASEVFEVRVRGVCLGACSVAARVGSMAAPQLSSLLPLSTVLQLYGMALLVAGVACRMFLPETKPVTPRAAQAPDSRDVDARRGYERLADS